MGKLNKPLTLLGAIGALALGGPAVALAVDEPQGSNNQSIVDNENSGNAGPSGEQGDVRNGQEGAQVEHPRWQARLCIGRINVTVGPNLDTRAMPAQPARSCLETDLRGVDWVKPETLEVSARGCMGEEHIGAVLTPVLDRGGNQLRGNPATAPAGVYHHVRDANGAMRKAMAHLGQRRVCDRHGRLRVADDHAMEGGRAPVGTRAHARISIEVLGEHSTEVAAVAGRQ